MLAVASLIGLLLAGFVLDAGTSEDEGDEARDRSPDPDARSGPLPGTQEEDADMAKDGIDTGDLLLTAAQRVDLPPPDMAEAPEDWDSLYGSDAAGQLYGGTGFDALFDTGMTAQAGPADAFGRGLITDFDPKLERLVLEIEGSGGPDPELSVTEETGAEGRVCEIRVDGALVCRVALAGDAPALTPGDIALVPAQDTDLA